MTTTSKRTFLLGTPLLIKMQSYVRLIYLRSYVKFCAIEPTGCLIISWWRSSGYIYCTIWTICSWVVTCDAKCSLPDVFINCRDLWLEKKYSFRKVFTHFQGVHRSLPRPKTVFWFLMHPHCRGRSYRKKNEIKLFFKPISSVFRTGCDPWLCPKCSVHLGLWHVTWTLGRNSTV